MPKPRVTADQRRVVEERAQGCCEYCLSQARFSSQPFAVEHVIPTIKSGDTVLDNLALACQGCNNHKYDKIEGYDPVGNKMALLYHPRRQRWGDHFTWNYDCTLIIGITPTGRATVETLHLNREGLVNMRGLLYAARKHPPVK